jgi:hypothetical protein
MVLSSRWTGLRTFQNSYAATAFTKDVNQRGVLEPGVVLRTFRSELQERWKKSRRSFGARTSSTSIGCAPASNGMSSSSNFSSF